MVTKCKTILYKTCDTCGKEEELVYRCIGCGAEHCCFCVFDSDAKPMHTTTSRGHYSNHIYICEKCALNPPLHIQRIHRVVENLIAFDKKSKELEKVRASLRGDLVAELGDDKDITCLVGVESNEAE